MSALTLDVQIPARNLHKISMQVSFNYAAIPAMIFVGILFTIVFTYFFLGYRRSRKLFAEETGRTPLFKSECAGWVGTLYYTLPLCEIRVYEDFVVVGSPAHSVLLRYPEIQEIVYDQYYRVIARGIAFVHQKSGVPERVIVFSPKNPSILKLLKERPVRITDKTAS